MTRLAEFLHRRPHAENILPPYNLTDEVDVPVFLDKSPDYFLERTSSGVLFVRQPLPESRFRRLDIRVSGASHIREYPRVVVGSFTGPVDDPLRQREQPGDYSERLLTVSPVNQRTADLNVPAGVPLTEIATVMEVAVEGVCLFNAYKELPESVQAAMRKPTPGKGTIFDEGGSGIFLSTMLLQDNQRIQELNRQGLDIDRDIDGYKYMRWALGRNLQLRIANE